MWRKWTIIVAHQLWKMISPASHAPSFSHKAPVSNLIRNSCHLKFEQREYEPKRRKPSPAIILDGVETQEDVILIWFKDVSLFVVALKAHHQAMSLMFNLMVETPCWLIVCACTTPQCFWRYLWITFSLQICLDSGSLCHRSPGVCSC